MTKQLSWAEAIKLYADGKQIRGKGGWIYWLHDGEPMAMSDTEDTPLQDKWAPPIREAPFTLAEEPPAKPEPIDKLKPENFHAWPVEANVEAIGHTVNRLIDQQNLLANAVFKSSGLSDSRDGGQA